MASGHDATHPLGLRSYLKAGARLLKGGTRLVVATGKKEETERLQRSEQPKPECGWKSPESTFFNKKTSSRCRWWAGELTPGCWWICGFIPNSPITLHDTQDPVDATNHVAQNPLDVLREKHTRCPFRWHKMDIWLACTVTDSAPIATFIISLRLTQMAIRIRKSKLFSSDFFFEILILIFRFKCKHELHDQKN